MRLSTGATCKVGTGLKDKDRDNPPAVGSIITVKYQETTPDGLLRFPVYVGPRHDGNPNAPVPTRKKEAPVAVAVSTPATPEKKEEKPAEDKPKVEAKPAAKPKAEPKPVPTPVPISVSTGGSTMAATPKRYFEFVDGTSNKFWEIWMDGTDVTTNWGKIGTDGQTKTKDFDSAAAARADADKLIAEKTKKGYDKV